MEPARSSSLVQPPARTRLIRWLIAKHVGAPHVPRQTKVLAWGMLAYGYTALLIGSSMTATRCVLATE